MFNQENENNTIALKIQSKKAWCWKEKWMGYRTSTAKFILFCYNQINLYPNFGKILKVE